MSSHVAPSLEFFYRLFKGKIPLLPDLHYSFVDVRDLCTAHLTAMTTPASDGQRYLVSGAGEHQASLKDVVTKIIQPLYPTAKLPSKGCPNMFIYMSALFMKDMPVGFMWNSLGQKTNVDNSRSPVPPLSRHDSGYL